MQSMRNSLTSFQPDALIVVGAVEYSGSTPSLADLSGFPEDQSAVSIVANSTGNVTISVTGFRGRRGKLKGIAAGTTISNMVSCTANSYTAATDTANFTFAVESDASTAVDNGFNFILLGY